MAVLLFSGVCKKAFLGLWPSGLSFVGLQKIQWVANVRTQDVRLHYTTALETGSEEKA